MNGRIGLATVESFISQLQTGQKMPEMHSSAGYDLAVFLDTSYKFINRQQEEQEGAMSAMIKKMQNMTQGKQEEE